MVRFLVLYDMPADPDAFDRHYREIHIPLAKQLPGLRRYTISRNHQPVRGDRSYYLVAELDWDDTAAMQQAFASEIGQASPRVSNDLRPLPACPAWSTEAAGV